MWTEALSRDREYSDGRSKIYGGSLSFGCRMISKDV